MGHAFVKGATPLVASAFSPPSLCLGSTPAQAQTKTAKFSQYTQNRTKEVQVFDFPFMFDSTQQARYVFNDLMGRKNIHLKVNADFLTLITTRHTV